jgi:hypothetical protein
MIDQQALYQRVESIKRRVAAHLVEKSSQALRSSPAYQAYIAMCGEAWWAYQENELDKNILRMLEESAEKLEAQIP